MIAHIDFWINIGTNYGVEFTDKQIKTMAEATASIPIEKMQEFLKQHVKSKFGFKTPTPIDFIRSMIPPEPEVQDVANEAPGRIFDAIRKHGYMDAVGARESMGELAWRVCENMGGYNHICSSDNLGSESTLRAQMRDLAKALNNREAINQRKLPELESSPLKNLIGNIKSLD